MTPGNKELRKKLILQDLVDFETTKLITGKCLFCGAEFKEIYTVDRFVTDMTKIYSKRLELSN